MKNLGEKIKDLRKSRGLTQGQLAERCGWLSQSRVGNYERNIREPSFEDLKKISEVLGYRMSDLLPDDQPTSNVARTDYAPEKFTYPVRRAQFSTGEWTHVTDLPATGETMEAKEYAGADGFWMKVSGDSMHFGSASPSFFEGMYILIKPNPKPAPGKYVVAIINQSQEATFKQYIVDAGMEYLKPINPAYPIIPISNNCTFIGEVIDVSMKGFL